MELVVPAVVEVDPRADGVDPDAHLPRDGFRAKSRFMESAGMFDGAVWELGGSVALAIDNEGNPVFACAILE